MYYIFFDLTSKVSGCVTNKKDRDRVIKQRPECKMIKIRDEDIHPSLINDMKDNIGISKYYGKWLFPNEEEDMFDATKRTLYDIHTVYCEIFEYLKYVVLKDEKLSEYIMILDKFGKKFEHSLFDDYREGLDDLVDMRKIVNDKFKLLLKGKLPGYE